MHTPRIRTSGRAFTATSVAVLVALAMPGSAVAAPVTERISVSNTGAPGFGFNRFAATSPDGRFVVFQSTAANLVPGDTNQNNDVFLRDRRTGRIELVSVNSAGVQGNGKNASGKVSVSADGRFVAFDSFSTNLVPGDTNGLNDIFVRDRYARTTVRVNQPGTGGQANGNSFHAAISADGQWIAYESEASNLVPGDTNGVGDIFLHQIFTGFTTRASVAGYGIQADRASFGPSISADGRFVAFNSHATNLAPGDVNGAADVFLRDRAGRTILISVDSANRPFPTGGFAAYLAGSTVDASGRFVTFSATGPDGQGRVYVRDHMAWLTREASVNSWGTPANSLSTRATISYSGRYVAYESFATNLVPGDTNNTADVFVHDLFIHTTICASVGTTGTPANGASSNAAASDGGTAFQSTAFNLVPGPPTWDIQVYFRSL